ncbi:hypothetical protein BpHYR1_001926 [Brachionus plicatilis]|uniref:Uncharacterized protein n=1 Tax=Brachionus plicatilis TaxID=10195 RepID=A0A3M7RRH3_BRAPC|nr:hypothetical protein BpHYR1_001926 [Brachionus plicatilis]
MLDYSVGSDKIKSIRDLFKNCHAEALKNLTNYVFVRMDEFIDCFNNLNIEHGFVTLYQKNKPLSIKDTKQDFTVTKKFGWRCTYPSCSSTFDTNGCIVGSSYDIKEVARMSDDNPRKIIATVRSDVLLKDKEVCKIKKYITLLDMLCLIIELDSMEVPSGLILLFSPLIIRVFLIKNFQIRLT